MSRVIIKEPDLNSLQTVLTLAEELHCLHSPYDFNYEFKKKYLIDIIGESEYYFKVGSINELVCSYLIARIQYDSINQYRYCHINEIVVLKEFRDQGIGKAMLEDLIEWLKKEKIKEVSANVTLNNYASEKLFSKYSFEPVSKKYIKHLPE